MNLWPESLIPPAAALREMRLVAQMSGLAGDQAPLAILERRFEYARRLAASSAHDDMPWATVFALSGDRERILSVLRRLIDDQNVIVVGMKDDPVFDPYRSQPAFQELIRTLHLPH